MPCAAAMPGVAMGMLRAFPEVENACRFYRGNVILGNESRNIRLRESTIYYADPAALPMFGVTLVAGDAKTARQIFETMLAARNPLGLLSEDTHPVTGEMWGNFPRKDI